MKLVYQTADFERANKIIGILKKAGIDSKLQGEHLFGLRTRHLGINPLTVWISNDAEEFRAHQVLETFYGSEAPPKASRPLSATRQLVLVITVAGLALVLAVFSH